MMIGLSKVTVMAILFPFRINIFLCNFDTFIIEIIDIKICFL